MKIQFVQSSSLQGSWALTLWNVLLGRRLLFASTFFFAGPVSSVAMNATPAWSGMCSLGDAEPPARTSLITRTEALPVRCASMWFPGLWWRVCLCNCGQHWRLLCLAGWQGNVSKFKRALVHRLRENVLLSSCQGRANVVGSLHRCRVTCPLG